MDYASAYRADTSLAGKIRRRLVRYVARRPLAGGPARPMISFSFDDAPKTAAEAGAAILEAQGLKGAYYVSAGVSGTEGPMGAYGDAPDYRRLIGAGHEIGCHTYSHLDCGRASGAQALADVERNGEALAALGAKPPTTFAYPYGDASFGPKRALAPRFALLRGVHHGLIEAGTDLNQAPAVGIEGDDGVAVANRWMDAALARKAWLILFTHDVREDPSPWGCTPAALERLVARAVADGFEVVTVAEGARRLSS